MASAEEFQNRVTSWFAGDPSPTKKSLYAPLTHDENEHLCGVGMNLILVHDPPLHVKSDRYTYINLVDSVERNSPASRAGIRREDIVIGIDGENLIDGQRMFLPEDLAEMTRGPEGSRVSVAVVREGLRMEFVLAREPLDGDGARAVVQQQQRQERRHQEIMADAYGTPSSSPAKKQRNIMPVTP